MRVLRDGSILLSNGVRLFPGEKIDVINIVEIVSDLIPPTTRFGGGRGPQGPQGEPGSVGATGATGAAGSGGVSILGIGADAPSVSAGQDREVSIYGPDNTFPDANMRIPLPRAGSFRDLTVNVTTNTLNAAMTVGVMVNGVVVLSVSYAAAETGIKTAAGPVAAVATDRVSFRVNASAAGSGSAVVTGAVAYG